MRHASAVQAAILVVAIAVGACDAAPGITAEPSAADAVTPPPTPAVTEAPFVPASWPPASSACGREGYGGRIGRIAAPDPLTIVFTLCTADGGFPARLAHPALGVLDAATIAQLASDRDVARTLAGTGAYRIARWVEGENVLLERVAGVASGEARTPTVVVSWDPDAAARTRRLEDAAVDGIDAPGPAQLEVIATQPELVVTPRPLLATTYLGFGAGRTYSSTRVRRAIAGSLDRAELTRTAFPQGSVVPTHLLPCGVPTACAGAPWYEFNAPAATAALAETGFDLEGPHLLRVPDAPIPGLLDPLRVADAVRTQLGTNIGMTVTVEPMPADEFRAAVDAGTIEGLYLAGITTSVPDPAAFLGPLFGGGAQGSPAKRVPEVPALLAQAVARIDPAERAASFAAAGDAIRAAAALVPLAHPGDVVAYRSDVAGVAVSPLGLDALGAATPGDRPQLVYQQATEPEGAYCADQASLDAYRVCGLVVDGLYGFVPGTLEPRPDLATCEGNPEATVWTCSLREGVEFADGAALDAGDVLASFVAQWDRSQPLRTARPDASFAAWDSLFGGTLGS